MSNEKNILIFYKMLQYKCAGSIFAQCWIVFTCDAMYSKWAFTFVYTILFFHIKHTQYFTLPHQSDRIPIGLLGLL